METQAITREHTESMESATTTGTLPRKETVVLIAGHGSPNPAGNHEIEKFVAQWRSTHPDWRIEVCFIEHADVLVPEGLDKAASQAHRVVLLPLILNAAGHVRIELPEAVEAARQRHPDVEFIVAPHLGMCHDVFTVLQRQLKQLMRSLDSPDPQTTGVVLLGRGSSDAEANGELARMARWLYEANDHELVDLAFTGVTWPRLETIVQRQVRLGMRQICILPVYLFTGVLIERIKAQVKRLQGQYPQVSFALGDYFGFEPEIFRLVDQLASAGVAGAGALLECDRCRFRAYHAYGGSDDAESHARHHHAHHSHHAHPANHRHSHHHQPSHHVHSHHG